MDFGNILEQWDEMQKAAVRKQKESGKNQVSHKKANAPSLEEKASGMQKKGSSFERKPEQRINEEELWLRRHGVIDKDSLAEKEDVRNKYTSRSSLANMEIEGKIDLHGLTREEAVQRLNAFVTECEHKKLRKIIIVHGKGIHSQGRDPVLSVTVQKFIEQDSRLGTSGHPESGMGGNGATWVILKNNIFK